VVYIAPFGKSGAPLFVSLQTLLQSVQSLGDFVAGRVGQREFALVDLDTRHNALLCGQRWQRCAVIGLLPEGFLEQDDTADELTQTRSCQYQAPVTAAMLFSGFNIDRLEMPKNTPSILLRYNSSAHHCHLTCRRPGPAGKSLCLTPGARLSWEKHWHWTAVHCE
jgi:hypothetical protein